MKIVRNKRKSVGTNQLLAVWRFETWNHPSDNQSGGFGHLFWTGPQLACLFVLLFFFFTRELDEEPKDTKMLKKKNRRCGWRSNKKLQNTVWVGEEKTFDKKKGIEIVEKKNQGWITFLHRFLFTSVKSAVTNWKYLWLIIEKFFYPPSPTRKKMGTQIFLA